MDSVEIINTKLWQTTLAEQCDQHEVHRKKLRNALTQFRENVKFLLSFIPSDMKDYTVHDVTHLDALWQMADMIAGEDFYLTPAEAFVFGGAVLLHDAGMSLAAYDQSLSKLKQTDQWKDLFISASNDTNKSENAAALEKKVTMEFLRTFHAEKAEELANKPFDFKNKDPQYLLEDSDLKNHYAELIGKIAHSHHWDHKELNKLPNSLGSWGTAPSEWSVDAKKVALLLRCADATHIDSRRAPSLLMKMTKPEG